jgi:hypothetical protein
MQSIASTGLGKIAYSIPEAVHVSGLGRSSLYGLMAAGDLAYVKAGKRRLIRHVDLEALIAQLTRHDGLR